MDSEEKKMIYKKLNELDSNIQRILFILESDSKTNNKGLVETVNDTKTAVDDLVLYKEVMKGKMAVYGGIGAGIVMAGAWLIKVIITNKIW